MITDISTIDRTTPPNSKPKRFKILARRPKKNLIIDVKQAILIPDDWTQTQVSDSIKFNNKQCFSRNHNQSQLVNNTACHITPSSHSYNLLKKESILRMSSSVSKKDFLPQIESSKVIKSTCLKLMLNDAGKRSRISRDKERIDACTVDSGTALSKKSSSILSRNSNGHPLHQTLDIPSLFGKQKKIKKHIKRKFSPIFTKFIDSEVHKVDELASSLVRPRRNSRTYKDFNSTA